jgi:phosphatidylserine decarboxylase
MAVNETLESEYFRDKRIQVSVFMSVWNVHINWYPVSGKIIYYRYHPGKYIVARYPKSSVKNERNTIVIEQPQKGQILVRQIAGIVARRIISNAHPDKIVRQGDELGFIRFGSRVDMFLPPGIKILVEPGDPVRGLQTAIARYE